MVEKIFPVRDLIPCLIKYLLTPDMLRSSKNFSRIQSMVFNSSGLSFSLQEVLILPSMMISCIFSEVNPVGVVPPSQRPVLASISILSRTRSAIVSLSSWAKTEAIYIMAFPIGFEVSNSSLIQINEIL